METISLELTKDELEIIKDALREQKHRLDKEARDKEANGEYATPMRLHSKENIDIIKKINTIIKEA